MIKTVILRKKAEKVVLHDKIKKIDRIIKVTYSIGSGGLHV